MPAWSTDCWPRPITANAGPGTGWDVVQYADTHGYDKDKLRPNAWPYRDYVIRAFNSDKAYGRFVREQIAGDALWPDTTDGIVATGFIAAGPWDFIGHAEVPETKIDGQVARNLDRDNMVTNTMNTFCSLTIQCARCHNHKLDPVTMKQYYGLQAVFAALDRADRTYDADPNTARRRATLRARRRQLETQRALLQRRIDSLRTPEIIALDKTHRRIAATRQRRRHWKRQTPHSLRLSRPRRPHTRHRQMGAGRPGSHDAY